MLRLGLICDFTEERWISMDLVGDMLFEQVARRHAKAISPQQIRPALRRRITAARRLRESRRAWNADRLWNRMVEYPRWLRNQHSSYDLFHIVDHSYGHLALGLPARRTIVTCHDLDTFRCLTDPAAEPRPLWFRLLARRILTGLRAAAHVIFVSGGVRNEAARLGLIGKEKSSVIPNGVHADAADERADREADALLGAAGHAGQGNAGPIVLSVGSAIPRKRLDILLRVFAGVSAANADARLVRAGGPLTGEQKDLAKQLGVDARITELPFLSRAVLTAVYRRATVLLQPSDAEGFCLPVAEAMACGCPVVAADLAVLRETGGDAAFYCERGDVPRWIQTVNGLLQLWEADPLFRDGVRRRSIANARRFDWQDNADQVVDVYRRVADAV